MVELVLDSVGKMSKYYEVYETFKGIINGRRVNNRLVKKVKSREGAIALFMENKKYRWIDVIDESGSVDTVVNEGEFYLL